VTPSKPAVGLIGPGRAGIGLALALTRAGYEVHLYGRRRIRVPSPLRLTVGHAHKPPAWLSQVGVVVLAVPDDAIRPLAESLAASEAVRPAQVVLHLSGVHGREALRPLAASRAALGSLHPLQTIADSRRAPERLLGSWAAVEGMPRAMAAGERLARDVGMRPFRLRGQAKVVYHAGAVFASNYFTVVEAVAQRLLSRAGLTPSQAWAALMPLVQGTLENLIAKGPVAALTGPVSRGDADTVRLHLDALSAREALLYRSLAGAALELAEQRALNRGLARRMRQMLER
jgi:predicted short-subunit dehydrogenase-like oxidoreductase (DUF2520 family)